MSKQESIQSERPTDTDGINIGGRPELFVDHYLIDQMYGTQLKLHAPVKKEIAIAFDQPWEGPGSSAYNSVFLMERSIACITVPARRRLPRKRAI